MDAEKRKRHCSGEDYGKRPKSGKDNGREDMTTVTEEEVEEFFTILKRIHVAARHFVKKDVGAGRKLSSQKLRLTFEDQDFEEDDEVVNRGDDEDKRAEAISGLDLNFDPASSTES